MITEPELGGEWKTESLDPARSGRPGGPGEGPAPRERAAGGARPWLWALGGVVAASAVWAGGLYALGDRLAGPEISYRASQNLCEDFRAQTLGGIAGDLHKARPMNQENVHPAVDGAACHLQNVEGMPDFIVVAQVDLHKKTDPSVEFGLPEVGEIAKYGAPRTEVVPGLGERAVLTVWPGGQWLNLKVLDGGAVFTVAASAVTYEEKNGRPATDADAVQAALIEDTRELMAALKK
ncbi:hypothetical protein ACWGE1_04150 [Streptomyces sp. NPDC054932]